MAGDRGGRSVADLRRLRYPRRHPGFAGSLEHHKIYPTTWPAKRLADAIRLLRATETLPLPGDQRIDLWGNTGYWAHLFSSELWLYYTFDDENLYLHAVHDHLSEM
jgi:hypothetical protein